VSSYSLALNIDDVLAQETGEVYEKFYAEAYVDGATAPIVLGSIANPMYVVVIGDTPGITFHIDAGTYEIGAFPFGVTAFVDDVAVPAVANITVSGSGQCIIMAGGNA